MRLRNKKTGEIAEVLTDSISIEILKDRENITGFYNSLAELNAEWEDVPEEPREYWFIDYDGGIIPFSKMEETTTDRMMKQIGNYFESLEEAKKAVEKLKAWKRLKDKGFRFIDHTDFDNGNITIWGKFNKELDGEDVHLLFGGEE